MAEPTEKTVKKLFALSGNICAFPGCQLPIVEDTGTITGEICHIKAKNKGGPRFDLTLRLKQRNEFNNLILLCRRHHKVIDDQPEIYSVDALTEIKSIHENLVGRKEMPQDLFYAKILLNNYKRISIGNNLGNIAIDSPGAIQGRTINIKTTKRKVSINAPPGTMGADQRISRYIQYLIKRYNEFAGSDKTRKTKFSYGAISRNIQSNFGAEWRLLPLERASEVIDYLQMRINKTRQARINKGKGYRVFSSYDQYLAKHGL